MDTRANNSSNAELPRVFISYHRNDAEAARTVFHWLKANGLQPWLDEESIELGDEWEVEIEEAIENADAFVLCLSPTFEAVGYRQKELRLALEAGDRRPLGRGFIVPFIVSPIDALPRGLKKIHVGDVSQATRPESLVRAVWKRCGVQDPGREVVPSAAQPTPEEPDRRALAGTIRRESLHSVSKLARECKIDGWQQMTKARVARAIAGDANLCAQALRILRKRRIVGYVTSFATVFVGVPLAFVVLGFLGCDGLAVSHTMLIGDLLQPKTLHPQVKVVAIDDRTLEELEASGAPDLRGTHAQILERLDDAGAQVIAFDLLFNTEKPQDDAVLAKAMAAVRQRGRRVVLSVELDSDELSAELRKPIEMDGSPIPLPDWGLVTVGRHFSFAGYTLFPVAAVGPARMVTGAVETPAVEQDKYIPGFALAAFAASLTDEATEAPIRIKNIDPFSLEITLTQSSERIYFYRLRSIERFDDPVALSAIAPSTRNSLEAATVSYYEVLRAPLKVLRDEFEDKIVLIGATNGVDNHWTASIRGPEVRPGVYWQADAVSNMLQRVAIRPLGELWQVLILLVLAYAAVGLRLTNYGRRRRSLFLILMTLLCAGGTIGLYVTSELLMSVTYAWVALWLAYWLTGRAKRRFTL